jgi:hypothetical protein
MTQETALQIIRAVAGGRGLGRPGTSTGSTDVQILQLVDLLNEEGQDLAARFAWQALIQEKTWTMLGAEDQGLLVGGSILTEADGFDYIFNDTIHNRTTQFPVTGPISPQMWQASKATTTVASPYSQYRIRGGHLLMYPAPTAGHTGAFEYKTENWVSNDEGDAFSSKFVEDDDFPLLDSRLLKLGLTWRWKKEKGLEYAEDFETYEAAVLDKITRDKTAKSARLDGTDTTGIQPVIAVARGSWPLT